MALYVIHEALWMSTSWVTQGRRYTVFADVQSAIQRCAFDILVPSQGLAIKIIFKASRMIENRNMIKIRWVPGYKGIPGNEEADRMAKISTTDVWTASPQSHQMLQVVSRAYLKRTATEKKCMESSNWWKLSIKESRGHLECKTPNFRPELHHVRKELASQFYQLMMGHAVIARYLKYKIKASDSDICWWCDADRWQTRDNCGWKEEIKHLWKRVEKDVGWRHYLYKPILALFNDNQVTEAILEFLDMTGVENMRGGIDENEEGKSDAKMEDGDDMD